MVKIIYKLINNKEKLFLNLIKTKTAKAEKTMVIITDIQVIMILLVLLVKYFKKK